MSSFAAPTAHPTPNRLHRCARSRALALGLASTLAGAWSSPAPGEAVRLDADAAARRAVEVSPIAAAVAARRDAAAAAVRAADALRLPVVAAAAGVTERNSVPEFSAPLGGPGTPPVVLYPDITTVTSSSVRASEALYTGGIVSATRSAARHDLAAVEAERSSALLDLALAARLASWESVRSDAVLAAAQANQERASRLVADTDALLEAGMAVRADLLAAAELAATSRVRTIRAENAAADAKARLRSLLALGDGDDLELTSSLAAPPPAPAGELAALQATALESRPELAAADARLAVLRTREAIARAPLRPTVALSAQWDMARPNSRMFPLADRWDDSWSVGVAASWTLFDGGKARADVSSAQATQRAAAAERDELGRRISLEVESAARELASAVAAVASADAARSAADERERASRERHQAGIAAMAEILDAEAALADAEQQQINARSLAWIAAARLDRALGRGAQ